MTVRIRSERGQRRGAQLTRALLALGWFVSCAPGAGFAREPEPTHGIRFGVGDRLTLQRGPQRWQPLAQRARQLRVPLDYLQIWLPRGWQEDWLPAWELRALRERGTLPVFVHYFFGDAISGERIEAQRAAWHASLERMARAVAPLGPVLIVLEPEFNTDPPAGETATLAWSGTVAAFRAAIRRVRDLAPEAQLGICAGDFYPDLNLDSMAPLADAIDFVAFQEMRAQSDPEVRRSGYLRIGAQAARYAHYLRATFDRPVLLAYVAVSSHGAWEAEQASAIRDLARHRGALELAGVFGIIYFQLQDDPEHRGHFGAAERQFGLTDAEGRAKPALRAFRELSAPRGGAAEVTDTRGRSTLR